MIDKLETDDQRPITLINKVNEVIDWINDYEEAIDNMDNQLKEDS